ncbi:hypothetical protein ScPMuIL_012196 [Solemya velum]
MYGTRSNQQDAANTEYGELLREISAKLSELISKFDGLGGAISDITTVSENQKFDIRVTDVKVLFADSGDDWHTAQTQPDSEYHILPSMAVTLAFFNAVKPNYKQLPRHKVVTSLPTLKLNMSDKRLITLLSFFDNFPMPTSTSMVTLAEDNVDGIMASPPVLIFSAIQHIAEDSVLKILGLERLPKTRRV